MIIPCGSGWLCRCCIAKVLPLAPNDRAAQGALEIVQEYVEEVIVVSDQAAIADQRLLLERAKVLTELAASCTLAAARTLTERWGADDQVVLVLCGGNESLANMMGYGGVF